MPESRLTFSSTGVPTTTGSPPYRITPTLDNAEAFLRLKPAGPPNDGSKTIASLLPQLNPLDLRKLLTIIDSDTYLRERLYGMQTEYAAIAYPGANSWPVPKSDEILDELKLSLGVIRGAVCTIDGHRYLATECNGSHRLMTLTEFKAYFEVSLDDYVRAEAKQVSAGIRALAALCASEPVKYEVSMISSDFAAVTKIVCAYTRDQLDRYAQRNKSTITNVEKVQHAART